MSEDEDQNLMQRVRQSDTVAMRRLYERYHDPLMAFLIGRGADLTTAPDVLQDTMLEVWRSADRFRGASSFKTWVFAIARNKLIDRQRKQSKMYDLVDVPEIADDALNPEAAAVASSDEKRVRRCLEGLKPAHLTAIRLAFYEDLNYAEIASIESVPVGTIKTRVHHAKRLLMRCLGHR
ncbi:RNA polymerase sigma factor [bacterium]|nr:RNA polymerase sigma factor [bacterium]